MIVARASLLILLLVACADGDSSGAARASARPSRSFPPWSAAFGASGNDESYSLAFDGDGGLIVAGSTTSFGSRRGWFLGLHGDGGVRSSWAIGTGSWDVTTSALELDDGSFVVSGYRSNSGRNFDGWLLRLEATGTPRWSKHLGGSNADFLDGVIDTTDGLVAFGTTQSFGNGGEDLWVVAVDRDGAVRWQKAYGGAGQDHASWLAATSDGFYLTGQTGSAGAGQLDLILMKLDTTGAVVWQRVGGTTRNDWATRGVVAPDGGVILVGLSDLAGRAQDGWLVRFSSTGDLEWQYTLGDSGEELFSDVVWSGDDLLVAGHTSSYGAGARDAWLLRLELAPQPSIVWQYAYGSGGNDETPSVRLGADGDVLLRSRTWSFGAGGEDVWIWRSDPDGNPPLSSAARASTSAVLTSGTAMAAVSALSEVDIAAAPLDHTTTVESVTVVTQTQ